MSHEPRHQGHSSENQDPAVDYFYSAAKHRSRGVLWPIFHSGAHMFQKNAMMVFDGTKHEVCERTLFISTTCSGTFSSWMPIMFWGELQFAGVR